MSLLSPELEITWRVDSGRLTNHRRAIELSDSITGLDVSFDSDWRAYFNVKWFEFEWIRVIRSDWNSWKLSRVCGARIARIHWSWRASWVQWNQMTLRLVRISESRERASRGAFVGCNCFTSFSSFMVWCNRAFAHKNSDPFWRKLP